jgi:hypothetical protein
MSRSFKLHAFSDRNLSSQCCRNHCFCLRHNRAHHRHGFARLANPVTNTDRRPRTPGNGGKWLGVLKEGAPNPFPLNANQVRAGDQASLSLLSSIAGVAVCSRCQSHISSSALHEDPGQPEKGGDCRRPPSSVPVPREPTPLIGSYERDRGRSNQNKGT